MKIKIQLLKKKSTQPNTNNWYLGCISWCRYGMAHTLTTLSLSTFFPPTILHSSYIWGGSNAKLSKGLKMLMWYEMFLVLFFSFSPVGVVQVVHQGVEVDTRLNPENYINFCIFYTFVLDSNSISELWRWAGTKQTFDFEVKFLSLKRIVSLFVSWWTVENLDETQISWLRNDWWV